MPPLGLNLEHHQPHQHQEEDDHNNSANTCASSTTTPVRMFPAIFGELAHSMSLRPTPPPRATAPQFHQAFVGQATQVGAMSGVPHPPVIRPRVRARRGQATDPHSIAERLRRERIAERMKALQELVPTANKTDRAAMLDEIVDYVKFLRLQVKILSMSRVGGGSAVAQLLSVEVGGATTNEECWDDGTEQQVAKLMEDDVGAAMQFLQSKALCIMPISFFKPQSTSPS